MTQMRDHSKPHPLTTRQGHVLAFLRAYVARHGYPPSVREVADEFQFASMKTAYEHLQALEHKGYILRAYATARAITLLPIRP